MEDGAGEGEREVDPEEDAVGFDQPGPGGGDAVSAHAADDAVEGEPGGGVED